MSLASERHMTVSISSTLFFLNCTSYATPHFLIIRSSNSRPPNLPPDLSIASSFKTFRTAYRACKLCEDYDRYVICERVGASMQ